MNVMRQAFGACGMDVRRMDGIVRGDGNKVSARVVSTAPESFRREQRGSCGVHASHPLAPRSRSRTFEMSDIVSARNIQRHTKTNIYFLLQQ